jgi:hypothetical protein
MTTAADFEAVIYWDQDTNPEPVDPNTKPYGDATARIIDENEGGVIAYCHKDTAPRLADALRRIAWAESRALRIQEIWKAEGGLTRHTRDIS